MIIIFCYTCIVDRERQEKSPTAEKHAIWSFLKIVYLEVIKMLYDMIREFGDEFVAAWCMLSTISVVSSVLIIACNIAVKF